MLGAKVMFGSGSMQVRDQSTFLWHDSCPCFCSNSCLPTECELWTNSKDLCPRYLGFIFFFQNACASLFVTPGP